MDEVDNGLSDEGSEETTMSVGERLKAAREQAGLSIEDVATQTRIPTRHLENLEKSQFSNLPAPTYTVGFAKGYAAAVGLDRREIGDAIRDELGSTRPNEFSHAELPEPADPSRAMPIWLIIAALAAVALVAAGFMWLQTRSLSGGDEPAVEAAAEGPAAAQTAAPAAAPVPSGPVVITANEQAWIQVYEDPGSVLFQGELGPGQSYEVPATAKAPLLLTGRPEALRISVGTADAPAVGPAGKSVSGVSLLAADLMSREAGPAATAPATDTATSTPTE